MLEGDLVDFTSASRRLMACLILVACVCSTPTTARAGALTSESFDAVAAIENPSSEILPIDLADQSVGTRLPGHYQNVGEAVVSPDGSIAYVAEYSSGGPPNGEIAIISMTTGGQIGSIKLKYGPQYLAISPDGSTLYALSIPIFTPYLTAINLATEGVKYTSALSQDWYVTSGLLVSPDGAAVYIGVSDQSNDGALLQVNAKTGKLVKAIRLKREGHSIPRPWGMALDGVSGTLYLTTDQGYLVAFDISSGIQTGATYLNQNLRQLAVSSDGTEAYLTAFKIKRNKPELLKVSLPSLSVTGATIIKGAPGGLFDYWDDVVVTDSGYCYINDFFDQKVISVNTSTLDQGPSLRLPGQVASLAAISS